MIAADVLGCEKLGWQQTLGSQTGLSCSQVTELLLMADVAWLVTMPLSHRMCAWNIGTP